MLRHLPILVVVAPLLGAPLCIVLRRPALARALALVVSVLVLACAVAMFTRAADGFVWRYALGGWPAPWGIAYRVDLLGALMVLLVALVAAVVALFSVRGSAREMDDNGYFPALFLLCVAGMLGIIVTDDLFNVFVFLEIAALSSYALVALGRGGAPPLAAYRYLMMGAVGATFFLIGVGYLYMMTGTLNMGDLAVRLSAAPSDRVVVAALAFISVGLAMKMALFPLHWWLPDAYTFAPSPVSALLAAVSTKTAIYLVARLFFGVFGAERALESTGFDTLLLALSATAIIIASVVAVYQDNVKRMMAYSSVAQIGYITLGVGLVSVSGVGAALVYLFNHALIKGMLFLALGCVVWRLGGCRIERFAGLGRRMPWTMAAIVVGGLSLIGVPLTAGFIGKWQLVVAAFDAGLWPLVVVVLAGSLITAIYVWRLVEAAYLQPPPGDAADRGEAPKALLIPVWILVALNFYVAFHADDLAEVAMRAARGVVGAGG